MSEWMLDIFASGQLNRTFWIVSLMTLPFWVMMLLFPKARLTQLVCHPFRAPVLYVFIWAFLLFEFVDVGLPSLPASFRFSDFRTWLGHPFPLMLLWMQVQIMNLMIGTLLYERESRSNGCRLWPEMLITWLFGPLGMLAHWVRLVFRWLLLRNDSKRRAA